MQPPPPLALDRARADWLAGDASAWVRYVTCLRQIETVRAAPAPAPPRPGRPVPLRA